MLTEILAAMLPTRNLSTLGVNAALVFNLRLYFAYNNFKILTA